MKPKAQTEHEDGLLEYLEDIIGTSKYKEPIEQAQVEVDELNDQRGEKMNRLRLVEKEKSALEVSSIHFGLPLTIAEQETRSRRLPPKRERVDEEKVSPLAVPHVHASKQLGDHIQGYCGCLFVQWRLIIFRKVLPPSWHANRRRMPAILQRLTSFREATTTSSLDLRFVLLTP